MSNSIYEAIPELNIDNRIEMPIIIMSKSGQKYGIIEDPQNFNHTHPLSDVSEISFDYIKVMDGQVQPVWDELRDFRLAYLPSCNLFYEITVQIDEGNDCIKHISGLHANEAELGQLMLYEVEINTEDDIDRDDYVTTKFYDEENPSGSLLHRILHDKAPYYEIIHVDDSLKNIQRQFSFDGTSIYDAFMDIAEEVECLFVFGLGENDGTYHRTVAVYDLLDYCPTCGKRGNYPDGVCTECGATDIIRGYGEDTNIYIDVENIADSVTYTTNTDEVKNCFRLEGGDEDMTAAIRAVTPSGSNYLWFITDEMKADMSPALVDKLNEYDELYNGYVSTQTIEYPTTEYIAYENLAEKYQSYSSEDYTIPNKTIRGYAQLTEDYYKAIDFYSFIDTTMMPYSSVVVDTSAKEQIEKLTSSTMSPIGVTDPSTLSNTTSATAVRDYAKVYVDTSLYKVQASTTSYANNTWSGMITVTAYADDEDTASVNLIIEFNDDEVTFVKQKIEKAMAQNEAQDIGAVDLLKKDDLNYIKDRLAQYSIASLDMLSSICQSALDVMIEQGMGEETNSNYSTMYYPYFQKMKLIQSALLEREEESTVINAFIEELENIRKTINDNLNMQTFLGEELWNELSFYRREDTYSNENFISDGLSDSELIEQAKAFYDSAQKELIKSATLQHSISASLRDFLLYAEYNDDTKLEFITGNWIHVRADNKVYKLRLTNWDIEYSSPLSLTVEFSDVVYGGNYVSDVASVVSQARSMATSYSYTQRQAEKGAKASQVINSKRLYDFDIMGTKIIPDTNTQNMVYDEHGLLMRSKNDLDDEYENEQTKLLNKGIYYTNDNWETVKAGLGHFSYIDPQTGQKVDAYGVIAETVVGKIILGNNVGIYNADNSFTVDENGVTITARPDTDNSGLFTIQKDNGDGTATRFIYMDSDGDLKISGHNITLGGDGDTIPLDTYIDNTIEDAIGDISEVIHVEIDSSAGWIFKNNNIVSNLVCHVYRGNTEITDQVIKFNWKKYNADGTLDTSWSRIDAGSVITISNSDVTSKAIFRCEVEV